MAIAKWHAGGIRTVDARKMVNSLSLLLSTFALSEA